jgi:hypothetical protein
MSVLRLLLAFLTLSIFTIDNPVGNAAPIPIPMGGGLTVDCVSAGCQQVRGNPLTFAVLEPANENGAEALDLNFNAPVVAPVDFNILDATDAAGKPCPLTNYPIACVSDEVLLGNLAANNKNAVVLFTSDFDANFVNTLPAACIETVVAGCTAVFTATFPQGVFAFRAFSDGDLVPALQSDTISVSFAPEPASWLLLATAIIGFLGFGWRGAQPVG